MPKFILNALCSLLISLNLQAQKVIPGAHRLDLYIPMLKGKNVALFANQTSMVGNTHVLDTLLVKGIHVKVIFGPEHGFRGTADAGEKVGNQVDAKTGIPVISLYGAKYAPSVEDLAGIDVVVFDIQDVGTRFYTYISSLEDLMNAVLPMKKQMIILDRPNPNGHYVDGPVLNREFHSHVGMQPIPVVYGMTIGEYAKMLIGEKWLKDNAVNTYDSLKRKGKDLLKIIPCAGYNHQSVYSLTIKPSPNLPDMSAIYWYPSTCFFEGTVLSEGRGTKKPFQYFGHPTLPANLFSFIPVSMPGATAPKLVNQKCYGWDLSAEPEAVRKKVNGRIQLSYLINAYKLFPDKEHFFIMPKSGDVKASFFNKLAGNEELMLQIIAGESEENIRKSWEPELTEFKAIRKKYLIYK